MLPRELYLPAAGEDSAQWCTVSYIDGELTREELWTTSGESDTYVDNKRRESRDNGRTWSEPESREGDVVQNLSAGGVVTYSGGGQFEARLGILYKRRMRRMWPGSKAYEYKWDSGEHNYNDHTFVVENSRHRISRDKLSQEKLLRYEDGPEFDPQDPFHPEFAVSNRAYLGQSIAFAEDGTAFHPMVCYRTGEGYSIKGGGVVLMRRDPESGEWTASNQQYIDPEISSRGLLEPDVAVLEDGRLLVVCRGSNTETAAGRKWFSVSTDGGATLSPVEELRYDDGSPFYSPSSIAYFFRSTRNGKLYWMANIVPEPPVGNGPRFPLYIAEIDEGATAVVKDSLIPVDDRGDDEPEALQLSNFCILENRETLDVEIYMTRIGENAEHFWQAGVYRYIFSPP